MHPNKIQTQTSGGFLDTEPPLRNKHDMDIGYIQCSSYLLTPSEYVNIKDTLVIPCMKIEGSKSFWVFNHKKNKHIP